MRKTFIKTGLVLQIQSNLGVQVTYFKGGRNFVDLTNAAETGTTSAITQRYEWSNFPDNEYLYIQLTSKADDAQIQF